MARGNSELIDPRASNIFTHLNEELMFRREVTTPRNIRTQDADISALAKRVSFAHAHNTQRSFSNFYKTCRHSGAHHDNILRNRTGIRDFGRSESREYSESESPTKARRLLGFQLLPQRRLRHDKD